MADLRIRHVLSIQMQIAGARIQSITIVISLTGYAPAEEPAHMPVFMTAIIGMYSQEHTLRILVIPFVRLVLPLIQAAWSRAAVKPQAFHQGIRSTLQIMEVRWAFPLS